jgi:hypothetical protein
MLSAAVFGVRVVLVEFHDSLRMKVLRGPFRGEEPPLAGLNLVGYGPFLGVWNIRTEHIP